MGIFDSIKKVATTAIKTAAESTSNAAASAKAAALVGSKASGNMSGTAPVSPTYEKAAAKAAALVGSKAKLSSSEVEAIIEEKVRMKGRPSNWRVSIVDLMTALDMNSSIDARKTLAARLNYSGSDADGSAEKNMWLHAELLNALARNGGNVPSNLL